MTNSSIPAPVIGTHNDGTLAGQLRLCRSLIGTEDKGGRDDARACIDRAAYVSGLMLATLKAAFQHHPSAFVLSTGLPLTDGLAAKPEIMTLRAVLAAIAAAEGRDSADAAPVAPQTHAAGQLTTFLCIGMYDDGSRFADTVEAANAEAAEAIAGMNWPAIELWAGFVALRDGVMTVEG